MRVSHSRRWTRRALSAAGLAAVAGVLVTEAGPIGIDASSHREAPLIAGDPRADNTDVYAFVSPDDPSTVTLISNWIPFEEPNGGPIFYPWADDTRYTIKIDNDGDAVADLTYEWVFDTVTRDADEFLANTGPFTSVTDPTLNRYQTYDLTLVTGGGMRIPLLGDDSGSSTPGDPAAAPSAAGTASTPDYEALVREATVALPGGGQTYAGQAEDPFFLDLRVFDLLYGGDLSEVGEDTLGGYNVNSVAIQVPKALLAMNGDAGRNPVIGVWSTTERRSASVGYDTPGTPDNQFVQVSRLGNPLVNEVVIPLARKDAFNSISPDVDATIPEVVQDVEEPRLPELIEAIYGVPAPPTPRNDLTEIFLQGISQANAGLSGDPAVVLPVDLNSLGLNADVGSIVPSEMMRLNMAVAPSAKPNRLGLLAGDLDGFPNGRRLTDDVVDIALQTVVGAAQSGQLVGALAAGDAVDRNDRAFKSSFPYLALPHLDSVNRGVERTPRAPEYVALHPDRVVDTRTGAKPAAGSTLTVDVTGVGSSMVPDDARTVFVNVTSDRAEGDGFVTVYPCDRPRPVASNFNPIAGLPTTGLVPAMVSAAGTVCIYTSVTTDLIVDIQGYHPVTAAYVPVVPERILETREEGGQVGYAGAQPAAGSTVTVKVTGLATSAIPADATAALLNVTATNAMSTGFVTAYPCDAPRPNASTVNLRPGTARANLVAAKLSASGTVCLYTSGTTDLIVDVEGYAPATSTYVPVVPERLLETRMAAGQVGYSGSKPTANQTIELRVVGVGRTQVPETAGAVFLNLTAAESLPGGFATVYPCGSPVPVASNLNYLDVDAANMVAAKVGEGGRVCIYTSAPTQLIADITGYFPGTQLAGS